jgi:RNA polymerase sigma-70 factor (ECF subfamily)
LPERVAAVFTLRVIDETEPDEACKVLGITPTNLWVVLHRPRARLRRCLELNWFSKGNRSVLKLCLKFGAGLGHD